MTPKFTGKAYWVTPLVYPRVLEVWIEDTIKEEKNGEEKIKYFITSRDYKMFFPIVNEEELYKTEKEAYNALIDKLKKEAQYYRDKAFYIEHVDIPNIEEYYLKEN